MIESSRIDWIDQAMGELAFQSWLIKQGAMHYRPLPESLVRAMEEFSLNSRRVKLGKVGETMIDLNNWIVTPRTLFKIVNRRSTGYRSETVKTWMQRLSGLFPQFDECLTKFRNVGYSLGVDALNIPAGQIAETYRSYEWLRDVTRSSE